MRFFLFLTIILFFSFDLLAKTNLNQAVLEEYLKAQKEFSNTMCTADSESKYSQLVKDYKGDGNFIPTLLDDKIDIKTIKTILPTLKEKDQWIMAQIEYLKSNTDLSNIKFELEKIENHVDVLLEAKKEYFFSKDESKKEKIKEKSARQYLQLIKDITQLREHIPFLLSFKFPINHLALRAEYDKHKSQIAKESRSKANSVYFYRKIVQDGTYDEDLQRNDSVIRASFDTLFLSITSEAPKSFITDNERVDIKFVLHNFEKLLSLKNTGLQARFEEWRLRNLRSIAFYQDLSEKKKIKTSDESELKTVTSLLEERAKSLYLLKDFVLKKEASTYEYWSRRSELFQSLYAIETILYSEVGRMDAPDALERRDVAQVVINRFDDKFFSSLTETDSITKYFSKDIKLNENKWLNVLFKEGEFSFTYFYIPGNFHIYCPDMSKVGQFLRRENVRIAIELLNKPRKDFKALRYFSRMSMYGRIEMDSLWDNYQAIGEVPGKPVKNPRKLYELIKQDRYKFLYDFELLGEAKDKKSKTQYLVVDIKGKNYVLSKNQQKQIFYYRNPHQFKYFSLIK